MKKILFLCCLLAISWASYGQSLYVKKVAYEGYDVVAYHRVQQAIAGTDKLAVVIDDIHYYFSSYEHQQLFLKDPDLYRPKFGGYCAIGIALYDGLYDIDPEDFLIDEGELYLFCPGEIDNWKADQERLKVLAELKWPALDQQQQTLQKKHSK